MLKLFSGTQGATAVQIFKDMWIAGTLGAFFVAFAQGLLIDVEAWLSNGHIDPGYTAIRLLGYGYLLWLLVYFFASTINAKLHPEEFSGAHIVFYMVQSFVSLGAAFALGMLDTTHGMTDKRSAFALVNLAVAIICFCSVVFFPDEFKNDWKARAADSISDMRVSGFVISATTVLVGEFANLYADDLLWIYCLTLCALWSVLVRFLVWVGNNAPPAAPKAHCCCKDGERNCSADKV